MYLYLLYKIVQNVNDVNK